MASNILTRDGPVSVPLNYRVPNGQQIQPVTVRATLDGTSAPGNFYGVLQAITPDGRVLWSATSREIAAGSIADISWYEGADALSSNVLSASDLSNGTTGTGAIVLKESPTIDSPTITTPTISGELTATDFAATGLTGTGAARFVGSTLGAAPLIGSWNICDFITTHSGTMWVYGNAGWVPVGSSVPAAILSTSSQGGVGYGAGAGSTYTQATDKTTQVVVATVSGSITLANSTLNAGARAAFLVNPSGGVFDCSAGDTVSLSMTGGTASGYQLAAGNAATGTGFRVVVTNITTATNLTEQPVVHYNITKGSQS